MPYLKYKGFYRLVIINTRLLQIDQPSDVTTVTNFNDLTKRYNWLDYQIFKN